MPTSRPLRRLATVLVLLGGMLLAPASRATGTSATVRSGRARLAAGDLGSGPRARPLAAVSGTNGVTWSDVPKTYWARRAIDYVGAANDWMRDYPKAADGTYSFQPTTIETRRYLARAAVRAFAPNEPVDPSITFADLPASDPFYASANVAVKLGWMRQTSSGFSPDDPVTTTMVHRVLVLALGLDADAAGLDALHTRNGVTFTTPPDFGTLLLGMRLGLRYNHADESLDVEPASELSRAEVAWSLYRAATAPQWALDELAPYATIVLPVLGPKMQQVVQFGIQYVGYPYVYGGEWYQATVAGYCCGTQPVGGFDCSGLAWWLMKAAAAGWNNVPPRGYHGWSLPQRSATDMAASGDTIAFADIRAGDLLFYSGSGNGVVDHVDVYLGNGWALDSSNGYAGVSILSVSSGWYRDHFVGAHRLIVPPAPTPSPSPSSSPSPGG